MFSSLIYALYNTIEKDFFPEKPRRKKIVVPKKMPLVWAANDKISDNVDSEEVKREPKLNDFWTKAYKNDEIVIEMPRVKKLKRRRTLQMQF